MTELPPEDNAKIWLIMLLDEQSMAKMEQGDGHMRTGVRGLISAEALEAIRFLIESGLDHSALIVVVRSLLNTIDDAAVPFIDEDGRRALAIPPHRNNAVLVLGRLISLFGEESTRTIYEAVRLVEQDSPGARFVLASLDTSGIRNKNTPK